MAKDLIKPRTLKGFRDYLPEAMIPREKLIATAQKVYRSFGFSPIDTPTLEYEEILTGKCSADEEEDEAVRQMYRFMDHGDRMVGMRFDLTVPLARFAAQHIGDLGTPFKRYHIATVWRGEKPHKGRYREFMQCDFDTIGTKSVVADIETALVIHDLFRAIGREFISDDFSAFTIHINNRKVLNGLLEKLDLRDKSSTILRSLDKLAKIGREKVVEELINGSGATEEQANEILTMADLAGTNEDVLSQLEPLVAGSETGEQGHAELRQLFEAVNASGALPERFKLDVSIARGLDYYTGTIFETFLDALPTIGSVCSGGRYDNLAELYTKQELPGIGASLGLDRLLAALEELNAIDKVGTTAEVLVVYFDQSRLNDYLKLANDVRSAGIGVEVYPDAKKLDKQLKYARRRCFRVLLMARENELADGKCQVENLNTREQFECSLADGSASVIETIQQILNSADQPDDENE